MHIHNVRQTSDAFYLDDIRVGNRAVIGAGSVLSGGVSIGHDSAVRLRSLACLGVPDRQELKGNSPQLRQLNTPPLGPLNLNRGRSLGSNVVLGSLSGFLHLLQSSQLAIILWIFLTFGSALVTTTSTTDRVGIVVIILGLLLDYTIIVEVLLAMLIGVCSLLSVSSVTYDSWRYLLTQRCRLILGRQMKTDLWICGVLKKLLLRLMGLVIIPSAEVLGHVLPHFQIPFPFVHIGRYATLTSEVWVGEEYWEGGVWNIQEVFIGEQSLVGNKGAVASGSTPSQSIVASLLWWTAHIIHHIPWQWVIQLNG